MQANCFDCPRRGCPECHTTDCEVWAAHEERKAKIKKYKEKYDAPAAYLAEGIQTRHNDWIRRNGKE